MQLSFTTPRRTTDGQALGQRTVRGELCRQETPNGPCRPLPLPGAEALLRVPQDGAQGAEAVWTDTLPPELRTGAPRPLAYRITLKNAAGKSAGPSDPVYVAAGEAPPALENFHAEGTRSGVLLQWTPVAAPGEILLQRAQLDPTISPEKPPATAPPAQARPARSRTPAPPRADKPTADPGVVWLQARAEGPQAGATLDGSADEGVRYRYVAVRQVTVKLGGRSLALRSTPSPAVEITWRDVYPPPARRG